MKTAASQNVIEMIEHLPHEVSEVICVKCGHRYISVRPISVILKRLECGQCGAVGFVIKTGQNLEADE